jgi:ribosomal-protein-alanine N-acetyltransferase
MLLGNLTRLRAFEKSDIILYGKWMENPDTVTALYGSLILDCHAQIETTYSDFLTRPAHSLLLVIETEEDKIPIGVCFFKNIHFTHRHAELEQLHIIPEYQNRGLGTDALRTAINYVFSEMNLNRVWLLSYSGNHQAIRFYRKIGFSEEGILRQVQFKTGQYHDGIIMAVLSDEWLKRKTPGQICPT